MRAGLYCRISSDPKGLKAGVERQESDCRDYAGRLGWAVAEVYVDNDVSAYSGKPRPAYRRMLEALEAGVLTAVVVWHNDRLHRSPLELEEFISLVERTGVSVAVVEGGEYDLTSPDGRLGARIVGAVARKESEDKSRRLRRKHLELAEQGRPSGGPRPFGQDHPEEAAEIAAAAKAVLSGASLRSITVDWNARSVAGRQWTTVTTKRVLTAPRVAGLREHHGRLHEASWPAALDRETWQEVRVVLMDPRRTMNGGSNARRYLLSGFIFCSLCDSRLHARPRSDKTRCYVCASGPNFGGCGKIRVVSDPLEAFVTNNALNRLESPDFRESMQSVEGPDTRNAALALAGAESRLAQLEEAHFVTGDLPASTYRRLRVKVEREIDRHRQELTAANRHSVLTSLPSDLREAWSGADLHWRRGILTSVVERVIVGPATLVGRNFFDKERVEMVWV